MEPTTLHQYDSVPERLHQHASVPEPLRAVVGQLIRFVKATYTLNRSAARRDVGLPSQQVQAAMHLALSGGLTVGELATELGVTPGWASRLADELVLAGHAVREQDPADRRVVRLRISPAMEARCAQIYCERSAAVARALEGASPEDLATFTRLIGRIAAEFETLAAPHRVDSSIGATMDPSSPPIASGDIRAARSSV